jgi:hypothetical protein
MYYIYKSQEDANLCNQLITESLNNCTQWSEVWLINLGDINTYIPRYAVAYHDCPGIPAYESIAEYTDDWWVGLPEEI